MVTVWHRERLNASSRARATISGAARLLPVRTQRAAFSRGAAPREQRSEVPHGRHARLRLVAPGASRYLPCPARVACRPPGASAPHRDCGARGRRRADRGRDASGQVALGGRSVANKPLVPRGPAAVKSPVGNASGGARDGECDAAAVAIRASVAPPMPPCPLLRSAPPASSRTRAARAR